MAIVTAGVILKATIDVGAAGLVNISCEMRRM
jgi:phosphoribosylformylglycinamidine (FGAM) synthase-like enzyme